MYFELVDYNIVEINLVLVECSYGVVLFVGKIIVLIKLLLEDFDVLVICCDGLGFFL